MANRETDVLTNPYQKLPAQAFWRPAVAEPSALDIQDLWSPKSFVKKNDGVATYGSCFAQHIGQALRQRGFSWEISESAPEGTPDDLARRYNYGIFSSRTGNIYTASLLRQWIEWAIGERAVPDEIWVRGDRLYDPFRPAIEPDGFGSQSELIQSRDFTLGRFKNSLEVSNYLVFTLGLTESWFNSELGYEYPMCPGTVAGEFIPEKHRFENQRFERVRDELLRALEMVRDLNPSIQVILTVSPVPLTATASGRHVLVATMQSKSILRAVAADLVDQYPWVDYFPSYEIINSPVYGGRFFESNKRNVTPDGVAHVMKSFFSANQTDVPTATSEAEATNEASPSAEQADDTAEVCEEALLEAFAGKQ